MWTVKLNVFLILNSVPVTLVTDPEFIRPSVPVIAHNLNQEVVARKAKILLPKSTSTGILAVE